MLLSYTSLMIHMTAQAPSGLSQAFHSDIDVSTGLLCRPEYITKASVTVNYINVEELVQDRIN